MIGREGFKKYIHKPTRAIAKQFLEMSDIPQELQEIEGSTFVFAPPEEGGKITAFVIPANDETKRLGEFDRLRIIRGEYIVWDLIKGKYFTIPKELFEDLYKED